MPAILFPMGCVLITPGALDLLAEIGLNPAALLRRHLTGDWGDLDAEDKQSNRAALRQGTRILSASRVAGRKFWVITEADRASTTILLPEEY
jgi:hypothetical protein